MDIPDRAERAMQTAARLIAVKAEAKLLEEEFAELMGGSNARQSQTDGSSCGSRARESSIPPRAPVANGSPEIEAARAWKGFHCRSCHAPVTWAVTASGKSAPWNNEPSSVGTVFLVPHYGEGGAIAELPLAIDVRKESAAVQAAVARGDPKFVSHFATCPHAKKWSKKH